MFFDIIRTDNIVHCFWVKISGGIVRIRPLFIIYYNVCELENGGANDVQEFVTRCKYITISGDKARAR